MGFDSKLYGRVSVLGIMEEENKMGERESISNFDKLAIDYPNREISDIEQLELFFRHFMNVTKGVVNVDFLDEDNWDHLEKVEIDKDEKLLFLYWKLPEEDEELAEMRRMVFPFDKYSLALSFQSLRFVTNKQDDCIAIVIKGYTVGRKDVITKLTKGGYSIKDIRENDHMIATEVLLAKDKERHLVRFLKTPITSFWIIPKDIYLNTSESRKYLFLWNLDNCQYRLRRIYKDLDKISGEHEDKETEQDSICQAGSSLRRVAETTFNLEVAFYYEKIRPRQEDYNNRRIGGLVKLLKQVMKGEDYAAFFNKISRLANDLSHDTGKSVKLSDAFELLEALKDHIKDFADAVKDEYNKRYEPVSIDVSQIPDLFVEKNITIWNFSEILEGAEIDGESKIAFGVELYWPEFSKWDSSLVLCKDGFFRLKVEEMDVNEYLITSSREYYVQLTQLIHEVIRKRCVDGGFDGDSASFCYNLQPVLHQIKKPTHLFTYEEMKFAMRHADDTKFNKLVIDEDGCVLVIDNPRLGSLYPVSHETFCAGNCYVGELSSLSTLEDHYVTSLKCWQLYLRTGLRQYSDLFEHCNDVELLREEIVREFYS